MRTLPNGAHAGRRAVQLRSYCTINDDSSIASEKGPHQVRCGPHGPLLTLNFRASARNLSLQRSEGTWPRLANRKADVESSTGPMKPNLHEEAHMTDKVKCGWVLGDEESTELLHCTVGAARIHHAHMQIGTTLGCLWVLLVSCTRVLPQPSM